MRFFSFQILSPFQSWRLNFFQKCAPTPVNIALKQNRQTSFLLNFLLYFSLFSIDGASFKDGWRQGKQVTDFVLSHFWDRITSKFGDCVSFDCRKTTAWSQRVYFTDYNASTTSETTRMSKHLWNCHRSSVAWLTQCSWCLAELHIIGQPFLYSISAGWPAHGLFEHSGSSCF